MTLTRQRRHKARTMMPAGEPAHVRGMIDTDFGAIPVVTDERVPRGAVGVHPGDLIDAVARQHGTTVEELRSNFTARCARINAPDSAYHTLGHPQCDPDEDLHVPGCPLYPLGRSDAECRATL